jgi:ribosomal protein L11 methyltransferase
MIDPGLAFGTGAHPTTYLCMQWLSEHPPKGKHVLDLGCGSGVLGLAALHLGARGVTAVDHDELARKATWHNAQLNDFEQTIEVLPPQLIKAQQFDLILANILTETLLELLPTIIHHTKGQGLIVLSGIMTHERQRVISSYNHYCDWLTAYEHEGWWCLQFQRQLD